MSTANLSFELVDGADSDATVALIQSKFASTPEVEKSMVAPDTDRIGVAEAVTFLAAAVVLVNQGDSLLAALTKFVATTRRLVVETAALKSAIIEINGKKIDATTITDKEISTLVEDIETKN